MVDELLAQLRAWGPSVFTLPMAHVEVGASGLRLTGDRWLRRRRA